MDAANQIIVAGKGRAVTPVESAGVISEFYSRSALSSREKHSQGWILTTDRKNTHVAKFISGMAKSVENIVNRFRSFRGTKIYPSIISDFYRGKNSPSCCFVGTQPLCKTKSTWISWTRTSIIGSRRLFDSSPLRHRFAVCATESGVILVVGGITCRHGDHRNIKQFRLSNECARASSKVDNVTLSKSCGAGYRGTSASVLRQIGSFKTLSCDEDDQIQWVPRLLHGCTAVAVGNTLVLFGVAGCGDGEIATLNTDAHDAKWVCVPSIERGPRNRTGHTAVSHNNAMWIFGGHDVEGITTFGDMWCFDFETMSWSCCSNGNHFLGPKPRYSHSAVIDRNGTMWVFGGVDSRCRMLSDMWSYDFGTNQWQEIKSSLGHIRPPAREGHTLTATAVGLILIGGNSGGCTRKDAWIFDIVTHIWVCIGHIEKLRRSFHTTLYIHDKQCTSEESELLIIGGQTDEKNGGSRMRGDALTFKLTRF